METLIPQKVYELTGFKDLRSFCFRQTLLNYSNLLPEICVLEYVFLSILSFPEHKHVTFRPTEKKTEPKIHRIDSSDDLTGSGQREMVSGLKMGFRSQDLSVYLSVLSLFIIIIIVIIIYIITDT